MVDSATEDNSIIESSPPTKSNTKPIERVGKWKESKAPQVKILPDSEADEPQRPKPKKVKVKVWDEINIAMKKIEGNKYGGGVELMGGKEKEMRETPTPKLKEDGEDNQDIMGRKRELRSEGAIANLIDEEIVPQIPEPSDLFINM